jgi:hypothetical protein
LLGLATEYVDDTLKTPEELEQHKEFTFRFISIRKLGS